MTNDPADDLASIRRRLATPEPGRLQDLRARQRQALHQILASHPQADTHPSNGEQK